MKTIEERAKEYSEDFVNRTPYDVFGGKAYICASEINVSGEVENAFIAGAKSEHEELTRWNENLDEVPDVYNKWCIVKIQNEEGFISYYVALALFGKLIMQELMNGEKIIGWREIHE